MSQEQDYPYNLKVVVLGGGTGQFNILRGLTKYNHPLNITAIPGTWDSGGSTGRLRTELGALPMGDARQCLVGLMEDERQQLWTLRESDDRFKNEVGPLQDHNFLNLELDLLTRLAGGFQQGIDAFREKYLIRGRVVPSSLLSLHLVAMLRSGDEIHGESAIDLRWKQAGFDPTDRIVRIYLNTPAEANPLAQQAIAEADLIVFSSGSLWGSVLPHLLIDGIPKAILTSKAKLMFNMNLMTERGQTDFFKGSAHLEPFLYYLGDPERLDYLVVNQDSLPTRVLQYYAEMGRQRPVDVDIEGCLKLAPRVKIVAAPLGEEVITQNLIRHNPELLARVVLNPGQFVI